MKKWQWKKVTLRLNYFFNKERSKRITKKVIFILFGSTVLISTYFLSIPFLSDILEYGEGDIAQKDIRIPRDIVYEKLDEIARQKLEAYKKQRYIFEIDYSKFNEVIKKLKYELSVMSSLRNLPDPVRAVKRQFPFLARTRSISDKDISNFLKEKNWQTILKWAVKYATLIFDNYGILKKPMPLLEDIQEIGAEISFINREIDSSEILIWQEDQFIEFSKIFQYKNFSRLTSLDDQDNPKFRKLVSQSTQKILIQRILQLYYNSPYVIYNAEKTAQMKESATKRVKPKKYTLKKGLLIARKGTVIDKSVYEKVKIMNKYQGETQFQYILGMLLLQSVLAIGIGFYIFRFLREHLQDISSNSILFSLILGYIFYAFIISRISIISDDGWYIALFLPNGFIGMTGTILLGPHLALIIGIYVSFFVFFLSGYEAASLIINFISIIAGIYIAKQMEKRNQVIKEALLIGAVIAALLLGFHYTSNTTNYDLNWMFLAAFLNGLACVILTSGLLPLYENIFNLPTKFKLLELVDNDNPLIKKISTEAPSTYTHTLMVSALSEKAVAALNGDVLLTKVGCLYHDIGKTVNPTFFAENRHLDEKSARFKKLGHYKSANIIINHVVDGIQIARENHLPEKVIAFIPEHHGTTTIQYFYHEALKEQEKNRNKKNKPVDKKDFQYPGPKPQTKETAVVMIADSVEAAARSLSRPTKENLSKVIDNIIENKLIEDQFDECEITLGDFKIIKQSFLDVLLNSFHLRPKYPTMKNTKSLEVSSSKKRNN